MKTCSKCGKTKPCTAFSKSRRAKDGLQSYCKECNRDYARARKDEAKEYYREYYRANKETIAARQRDYYRRTKQKACSKCKEVKADSEFYTCSKGGLQSRCKECKKADSRAQRKDNPRLRRQVRAGCTNLRAKSLGIPGKLTHQDIARIEGRPCFYCGTPEAAEIDHLVPLSSPKSRNTGTNLVQCCGTCNRRKQAKSLGSWLREIGWRG